MMFQSLLLILLVVIGLYFLGYLIAPKRKRVKYKEEPYAAGMDLPIIRQKYESKIVLFALLFLVFDIMAFMFVISEGVLYPILYLIIVLLGMILVGNSVT